MKQDTSREQVQIVVRAEHIILSHGIETVRRLFRGDRPPDAKEQFASIQRLITKIVEHFTYEENRMLPMLLAATLHQPVPPIIAELRQEHATLLRQVEHLLPLLHGCDIANCKEFLWVAMLDFLGHVEQHIIKEERLFQLLTRAMSPPALPTQC